MDNQSIWIATALAAICIVTFVGVRFGLVQGIKYAYFYVRRSIRYVLSTLKWQFTHFVMWIIPWNWKENSIFIRYWFFEQNPQTYGQNRLEYLDGCCEMLAKHYRCKALNCQNKFLRMHLKKTIRNLDAANLWHYRKISRYFKTLSKLRKQTFMVPYYDRLNRFWLIKKSLVATEIERRKRL